MLQSLLRRVHFAAEPPRASTATPYATRLHMQMWKEKDTTHTTNYAEHSRLDKQAGRKRVQQLNRYVSDTQSVNACRVHRQPGYRQTDRQACTQDAPTKRTTNTQTHTYTTHRHIKTHHHVDAQTHMPHNTHDFRDKTTYSRTHTQSLTHRHTHTHTSQAT